MFGLTPYNRRNSEVQRARNGLDMSAWFDNFFNDSFFPFAYSNNIGMKVDIKENDKNYVVEAELPGVNKDEINVELRDDRLTIMVQRDESNEEESDNYIRKERRNSSMSRSFYVSGVKPEDVNAKFDNGVLTISLLKTEDQKKKQHRIDIN